MSDPTLEAEKRNGVYLLSIESEYDGYSVHSAADSATVASIHINGNYAGVSGTLETECNDYEINGGTLELTYDQ